MAPRRPHQPRWAAATAVANLHVVVRVLGRGALAAVRVPVLPQLAVLAYVWRHFHRRIADHLQLQDWAWKPAFPRAWTAWVALLYALPVWAGVLLVWTLAVWALSSRLRGRRKNSLAGRDWEREGFIGMRGGGDEEEQWEDVKDPRGRAHGFGARIPNLAAIWRGALCVFYLSLLLYGHHHYNHYEHPADVRFRPALQKALADAHPRREGYARGERIFIAAAFHQNEDVLPYWSKSMLDAITYLGPDNVFVSVVENYSSDRSPELLRAFKAELDRRRVRNRILVQDESVPRPTVLEWNPRIEFLAAIRNQALEPLRAIGGYDRVLFSNDIYIEPESIIELLETANGEYDYACALDFGHYGAYDAWVIRDRAGRLTSTIWPYFFDAASADAMRAEEPVPVLTCWNGIVAFAADPLLPVHLRANSTLSTAPLPHPPPAGHPWARKLGASPALTPPLEFRASVEGECYSSESFLLPYDFRRVMALDRIFVNPRVATGYIWKYYSWHKWVLRSPWVKWFVEEVYAGAWMQDVRMIIGDAKTVWIWDGIECQPWW